MKIIKVASSTIIDAGGNEIKMGDYIRRPMLFGLAAEGLVQNIQVFPNDSGAEEPTRMAIEHLESNKKSRFRNKDNEFMDDLTLENYKNGEPCKIIFHVKQRYMGLQDQVGEKHKLKNPELKKLEDRNEDGDMFTKEAWPIEDFGVINNGIVYAGFVFKIDPSI